LIFLNFAAHVYHLSFPRRRESSAFKMKSIFVFLLDTRLRAYDKMGGEITSPMFLALKTLGAQHRGKS
jgi:hypothetical protein